MSNRVVTVGGGALLAGAAYYFYQAGGDPKVAQKKVEADAARVSHEVRDHIPGSAKEMKKDAESAAAQAQSKFNQLGRDAKAEANKMDNKIGQLSQDASKQLDAAGKEINKNIDKFDNTVEAEASKAKSGLSGWFGGK
ncbi:uncharacterized protein RCC_08171 [Ramularia collo-cygni]|uniref:Calcofluor white hypersensitive protein n=1 Tax=Ramularia collo-cygni TaxID=112498 RepID=A0A2D3UWU7_9PEZI|nr:uncharacterized protein RCC_08171 [Ramularia collo-cygni]CZT22302.1 uncharacterized protein RCC_08171 [Ramularia collo-cygni]